MAYVYRHIRLDKNEVFYIGIADDKEYKRSLSKYSRNKHWLNIVSKTEYIVEIILDGLKKEEACLKEIEFISLYGRKDLKNGTLVNKTGGGDGSLKRVWTKEQIESVKSKNRNKFVSDETKRKIKESHVGMKGKVHSEKSKDTMKENNGRNVIVLNIENGVYYFNITDASNSYSISRQHLCRMLKGQRRNWTNLIIA